MKNLVRLLFTSLIAFSLCGCTVSPQGGSHVHTFSEEWSINDDYHWHQATCGHDVSKDKSLHTFGSWIIDKEATLTEDGLQHHVCSVCGFTQNEKIDKLSHIHVPGEELYENIIEATCTDDGSYDIVVRCTECNEIISSEHVVTPKLNHNYVLKSHKDASYLDDGEDVYECSRCHDVYTEIIPRLKYKVTFDSNGGSEVETQYINHGEKVVKPDDPVKKGYTFCDWLYEGEVWSFIGYVVTCDMTLTATWKIDYYDIDLYYSEPLGGLISGGGSYAYGSIATINASCYDGYEFVGWFDENDNLVYESAFTQFLVEEPIKLTAKWKLVLYELTIVSADESSGSVDIIQSGENYGDDVLFKVNPNKGYDFRVLENGQVAEYCQFVRPDKVYFNIDKPAAWDQIYIYLWNTDTGAVEASWPGTKINPTGGEYKYTANSKDYTHFILNNGYAGDGNQTMDIWLDWYFMEGEWYYYIGYFGSPIVMYIGSKADLVFTFDMPARDTHIICDFVKYAYLVTYAMDYGTNNPSNPEYFYYGDNIELLPATRSGYKFLYWHDGNGNVVTHLGSRIRTYLLFPVWQAL